jgi:CRISPR-associated protein Cas1
MKNSIYIFSNSILRRKNSSFEIETMQNSDMQCDIDLFEDESNNVILPPNNDRGQNTKHLPAESVDAFYTFGNIRFSLNFLNCCNYYNIPVHFFNYYGKYQGSFLPANDSSSGKVILKQCEFYFDHSKRLNIAKQFIAAAAKNTIENLNVHLFAGAELKDDIQNICTLKESINFAQSVNELMGIEGNIKALYYQAWNKFLKQDTNFLKRIKNPPDGMINSLISYGNAVLYSVCLNEIYRTRLNPFIGFLHEAGDSKLSLAFDIAEIFKPVIVDKIIFRVINLKMISENDFKKSNNNFYMNEKARKKFLEEFENRLKTIITVKKLNRRISYRSLIRLECYNLINYILGKQKSYQAYKYI